MEGSAAEAIRSAEASLARQQTATAQIDLQVVTAVLNAHTDRESGTAALEQLQADVEAAVTSRLDLNTPAGARSFQHYLLGKLRDIRSVVDDADLDATSRASLAAALSALYASSTEPSPEPLDLSLPTPDPAPPEPVPVEAAPSPPPAAAAPATPPPPAMPSWTPSSMGTPPSLPDLPSAADHPRHHPQHDPPAEDVVPQADAVAAPAPELEKVITAAVAGTPIAEAFSAEGITIPAAGSPIAEPVDPAQLAAGDIGIFADRHALALGNGKALLDNQIQPVTAIGGPGFIGWQHPPKAGVGHG